MKKLLILLAVAVLPAASGCCATRLCPCCPCNWFSRPTTVTAVPACPPTYVAPMASPCAPSPCAPMTQFAPVSTSASIMPAMVQPLASSCATCPSAPVITQAQPMYFQAPMQAAMPTAACCPAEPSCAYMGEVGCGYGGPAMVGYGGDCCNSCGSCDSCGGGGGCSSCSGGGVPASTSTTPTPAGAPDRFQDPAPGA